MSVLHLQRYNSAVYLKLNTHFIVFDSIKVAEQNKESTYKNQL